MHAHRRPDHLEPAEALSKLDAGVAQCVVCGRNAGRLAGVDAKDVAERRDKAVGVASEALHASRNAGKGDAAPREIRTQRNRFRRMGAKLCRTRPGERRHEPQSRRCRRQLSA